MTRPDKYREAAVGYAVTEGWSVFPLRPRHKEPVTKNGLLDSSNDPVVVQAMFYRSLLNVGINCGESGLLIVDLDGLDGMGYRDDFPPTRFVHTNRGVHLYYHGTGNSTSGQLGKGVDTKGLGGYVVAPPSVHPDGGEYEWDDQEEPIADLPPTVAIALNPKRIENPNRYEPRNARQAQSLLWNAVMRFRDAEVGHRNDALNRSVWRMRGVVPDRDVARLFVEEGVRIGLTERECVATVASALQVSRREVEEWLR